MIQILKSGSVRARVFKHQINLTEKFKTKKMVLIF